MGLKKLDNDERLKCFKCPHNLLGECMLFDDEYCLKGDEYGLE